MAHDMAAFILRRNSKLDRLFRIDRDGALVGSITIEGSDPTLQPGEARLRWFFVAGHARGRGLGRLLMREAVSFLKEANFQSCHLLTAKGLEAARRLYVEAGFRLAHESASAKFGQSFILQRYVLDLTAPLP